MLESYKRVKRPAKCPICGYTFQNGDMVYTVPDAKKCANGAKAFVCTEHAETVGYHNTAVKRFCEPENYRGTLGKYGLLFGIELEVMARRYPIEVDGVVIDSAKNALAYIAYVWGLKWTEDATVYAEGNMPPETTMCGWRDKIARTLVVLAPNHRNAGAHLTIGRAFSQYNIPNFEYFTSVRVLDALATVLLRADEEEVKFVFGRNFTNYAEFTTGSYNHGDWANIRSNGSIEFRLCHIDNVEQYLRTASFLAEVCKLIIAEQNKPTEKDAKLEKKVETLFNQALRKELAVDNRSKMEGVNRKRNVDKK